MPHYELTFINPASRRSHPVQFRAASPESARILASQLIVNQLQGSRVAEAVLSTAGTAASESLHWKDGIWEREAEEPARLDAEGGKRP
ncbi:hypothetical protein J2W21_003065 [Sinomonas atrocyanea]|uniref:hypothetical protein n=1 Tax=Sinomonas atrocyanea TaxID=37927 RepID=UPI0027848D94|nr:hypothetical protein [Sinomonas atrocyanea]MDP9885541.1 hypothetical protein [Sinomonas atrocyanea]